jgi:hypothetical protein
LLLEAPMGFNAVKWVSANQAALNGVAVGLVVLGILLQAIAAPDEEAKEKAVEEEPEPAEPHTQVHTHAGKVKARPWWRKILGAGAPT